MATARSVRPSPLKSPATRRAGAITRRVRHLVLEGAVAVAQQHRHVVGAVVGDGQVGAAVAVEVPRHEGDLARSPPRTVTWFWKVPSPLPSNTDTSSEP